MGLKLADIKDDDALEEAVKKATDEATKGLKDKNAELGRDVKKMREQLAAFDGVTADDLTAMKEAVEEQKKQKDKQLEDKGEYEKLLEQIRTDHKKQLKEANDAQAAAKDALNKQLRQGGLTQALAAHCVPELLDTAVKVLIDDVAVVEQDGTMVARVGERSVADHVTEWFKSDVGKRFARAQNGSGGDAGGSGGSGGGSGGVKPAELFDPSSPNYNLTKAGQWMNENDDNRKQGQQLLGKYHGASEAATQ